MKDGDGAFYEGANCFVLCLRNRRSVALYYFFYRRLQESSQRGVLTKQRQSKNIKPISTTLPCINYNCSIRIYEAVAITENGKAEEWQHLFYMSVCLLCSVNIPSSLNWILIIKIMNYISTMNKLWIDRIICNYLYV